MDDKGQAVAGRVIEIYVKGSLFEPVASAQKPTTRGDFDSPVCRRESRCQFRSRYEADDPGAYIEQGDERLSRMQRERGIS